MANLLQVIVPEATTNLCTNPSFELNANGWSLTGGSAARSTTYQRYGAYSYAITPSASVNDGVYHEMTLATSTAHTATVNIYGANGVPYQIYFYDVTAGSTLGSATTFTGTGAWQEQTVTATTGVNTTIRLYIAKNNSADTTVFYIDGIQVEAKSYQTTYCLDPGTLVVERKGIKQLDKICQGDELLDHTRSWNRVEWAESVYMDAYEITLETGLTVIASANHRFHACPHHLGYSGDFHWTWTRVSDLTTGDYLHLSTLAYACSEDSSKAVDLAYLSGYLLGDGYLTRQSNEKPMVCWTFGKNAKDSAQFVQRSLERAFGNQKRYPQVKLANVNEHVVRSESSGILSVFVSLGHVIGARACEKTLPSSVWNYNHTELLAFLAGYIDADGSVDLRGALKVDTTSEQLARQLQLLLALRLGIHGWLGCYSPGSLGNVKHPLWRINLKKGDARRLRNMGLRLRNKKKSQRLANCEGTIIRDDAKVVDIHALGRRRLIEITLSPGHAFIANGIVTHNCDGDQDGCEWTGTEHGSTSTRSATSRAGGRVYNVGTATLKELEIHGGGMPPVDLITQPQAMLPGELYQRTKIQPRIISVVLAVIAAAGDTDTYHSARKTLISRIAPDELS